MLTKLLTKELVAAEKAVERAQDAVDRNESEAITLIRTLAQAESDRDQIERTLKGMVGA